MYVIQSCHLLGVKKNISSHAYRAWRILVPPIGLVGFFVYFRLVPPFFYMGVPTPAGDLTP